MEKMLKTTSLDFLLPTALAIYWYFWLKKIGIALSPDSTHYLFHSLHIFYNFDFSFIKTVWPPAYPTFLAIAQFFDRSPTGAAVIVSVVTLFLTLLFLNLSLQRVGVSLGWRIFAVGLLFAHSQFLYIFTFAWSESIFTAATMIFLYFLIVHHQEEKFIYLVIVAIFVSISAMSRYLGYYAIGIFTVYIVFFLIKSKKKFHQTFPYILLLIVAALPSFGWILRNYIRVVHE